MEEKMLDAALTSINFSLFNTIIIYTDIYMYISV